ncbi:hypothetical protein [Streptomyces sp. NPDC001758]
MRSTGIRRTAVALGVGALVLTACGSDGDDAAGGKTRITVNCMPPKSAKADRQFFEEDIAAFEKQNPDIDVVPHDAFACQDPKTFDAKLAGGQMEDVFYTYFTDARHVVDIGRAADLTPYVKELKSYETVQQQLRDIAADRQARDPGSMLSLYRAAIRLRPAFGDGPLTWLPAADGVLAFTRADGTALCVVNLADPPALLPAHTAPLLASGPLSPDGRLPKDTAVWLRA